MLQGRPVDRQVGLNCRLAGPTQPAPERKRHLEFRFACCFVHLAFASSPHPATFLLTSRVSCVRHLLHQALCNVCVAPLSAAIPTAEYIARIEHIAPLAPLVLYCATPAPALRRRCLGPLPQPSLHRWRTPSSCLPPTLTTATLSLALETPAGARGRLRGAWSLPAWMTPPTAIWGRIRTTAPVP